MMANRKLPFKNLNSKAWGNLAIAATITFYITIFCFTLLNLNICRNIGFDYCAYWSAGKIINKSGYTDIYNIEYLHQIQKKIYFQENEFSTFFQAIEIPYFPVFVIPFQFLAIIDLVPSYFVWAAVNLSIFSLYLIFFSNSISPSSCIKSRLILMLIISLPVCINFMEGQLNVWLAIFVGECLRNFLLDKPFKAGIWLGGLLLKPQFLVLILPFLLLQRKFKALGGFFVSTLSLLLISLGMISFAGFNDMLKIWLTSGKGGGTSNAPAMMNWRMVGTHITSISSATIGYTIIILGTLSTILITLIGFKKKTNSTSPKFTISLLGVFAATCVVSWHAHLHTAMILIPPLLYLRLIKKIRKELFQMWVFIPVLVHLISFILINTGYPSSTINNSKNVIYFLGGMTGLILNLIILGWSLSKFKGNETN